MTATPSFLDPRVVRVAAYSDGCSDRCGRYPRWDACDGGDPAMSVARPSLPQGEKPSIRAAIVWGVAVGAIQAATPLGFWWLDPATVYAFGLVVIASVYIGFAVANGRWRVIAVESGVAMAFVVIAAVASPGRRSSSRWGSGPTGSRTLGSNDASMFPAPGGGLHSAPPSTGWWLSSSRSRSSPGSTSDHSGSRSEGAKEETYEGDRPGKVRPSRHPEA